MYENSEFIEESVELLSGSATSTEYGSDVVSGIDNSGISELYEIDGADLVSDTDSADNSISSSDLETLQTQSEILLDSDLQNDIIFQLQTINYKLSIIVFLLLFFWCLKRIKSSVAKFTGRGIDE